MKNLLFILMGLLFSSSLLAQTTITGTVKDADNMPIPGASVIAAGTSNGTMTDIDGKYSIEVSSEVTILMYSFIGMETKKLEIAGQSVIDVTLTADEVNIDEVIVVGYGVQKKSDVTGSISSVDTESLESQAVSNTASLLQGRAAGVQVTNTSGEPGGGISVRIRGTGTVNSAGPLYVVDGIFLDDISHINPSDIKSLEVLKDASATAIYGSRGANGVILITTKIGNTDDVLVQVEVMHAIQKAWKTPDLMNSKDWLNIYNTAQTNANTHTGSSEYAQLTLKAPSDDINHTTDWFDEVTRVGKVDKMNVSISRGNEKSNTLFSVGYFKNEGILQYSEYERLNARLNTNYSIGSIFKTGINLSISNTNRNDISGSAISGPLTLAQRIDPLTPVKDETTGEYVSSPYSDLRNPVALLDRDIDEASALLILANSYFQAEPIKGLILKTSLSLNISNSKTKSYEPIYDYGSGEKRTTNSLSKRTSQFFGWLTENTATYNKSFGEHNITLLAGFTAERNQSEYLYASRGGIPNDLLEMQYISASSDIESTNASNSGEDTRMFSYLGRLNYNYANKYFLTASIRRDGSSVFGPDHRFGNFPSASLGWKLRNESFMDFLSEDIVNALKIRVGWGKVGNAKITPYSFSSTMQIKDAKVEYSYVFGDEEYAGAAPVQMANKKIHWESVESTNVGIDLGFFNDKLIFSADYFIKTTEDMLVKVPIPSYAGYDGSPYSNVGKVENKGFELNLGYRGELGNEFKYNINLNASHVKNEVIDLGGSAAMWAGSTSLVGDATRTSEGYPIGAFWGYELDGVFQTKAEADASAQSSENLGAGDFKFKDQITIDDDGNEVAPDGVINGDDRVMIGNPIPDLYYGINIDMTYKNFDVSMFFQGVYGNELFNAFKYYNYDVNKKYAFASDYSNYWTASNGSQEMFGLNSATVVQNLRVSDFYIEDGSYLRLKNLQIGYTFKNVTPWLANTRIYFSAQNLLTFTKYTGLDPEIGGGTLSQGVDYGTYPQARSFSFGASLTF